MEIVLYGLKYPSRATRVAWALEEAGASWSHVSVDLRSDAYRQVNPYRKVPSLSVDGTILTESAACCLWVADAFPDVSELAARCRFRDCSHTHEPECAVRGALEAGTLARERYAAYRRVADSLE